jgi:ribonuclease HII
MPDFRLELKARKAGHWPVAGVDEAGRGPLAGPVVAAAVILDPDRIPEGLNDSKQLSARRREELFEQILATATVAIASSSSRRIDETDIRKASLDAMRRAICSLSMPASFVLTDGLDVPPGLDCPGQAVVKGDARSVSIAAASIVAKVTRDRMMNRADLIFPAYGFAAHAGYGTVKHRAGIDSHGPCPLHRMSFGTLKRFVIIDGE